MDRQFNRTVCPFKYIFFGRILSFKHFYCLRIFIDYGLLRAMTALLGPVKVRHNFSYVGCCRQGLRHLVAVAAMSTLFLGAIPGTTLRQNARWHWCVSMDIPEPLDMRRGRPPMGGLEVTLLFPSQKKGARTNTILSA